MYRTFNIFDDILGLKNTVDMFINGRIDQNYSERNPLVNIYEENDNITVKAIAPGANIEDIKVELINNMLNITVNKKSDHNKEKYIREERIFGEFTKTVKLPYKVNSDKINASLKDGILTITLEKSEDAKPKKIEIL